MNNAKRVESPSGPKTKVLAFVYILYVLVFILHAVLCRGSVSKNIIVKYLHTRVLVTVPIVTIFSFMSLIRDDSRMSFIEH